MQAAAIQDNLFLVQKDMVRSDATMDYFFFVEEVDGFSQLYSQPDQFCLLGCLVDHFIELVGVVSLDQVYDISFVEVG
jgi:hypothetical protein